VFTKVLKKFGFGIWYQNLNECKQTHKKGFPWHGRGSLYEQSSTGQRKSLGLEWSLFNKKIALGVSNSFDFLDNEIKFGFRIPGFSLWLRAENFMPKSWLRKWEEASRETSISLFYEEDSKEWFFSWELWSDDLGWSQQKRSWWRKQFIGLNSLFWGEEKVKMTTYKSCEFPIPLPEGNYPAKIELKERLGKRKRWPFSQKHFSADVKFLKPIPIPGKGENSWDCGDDAYYGMGFPCKSVEEAVGHVVTSVYRTRLRYGGERCLDWSVEHS